MKSTALPSSRCCFIAEKELFEKVEELLINTHIIKDYHLNYLNSEEKENGAYLYLTNKEGEMCAAGVSVVKNGVAQGIGIAIKDEFKMQGLAPFLGYYRMKWLSDNNVKLIQAWVLNNNEASLRYHTSLGYSLTNKYADEWVKEVGKK